MTCTTRHVSTFVPARLQPLLAAICCMGLALLLGPALGAQCSPPVIKNSVLLTLPEPRGIAHVESLGQLYVASRYGDAIRFDLNLNPLTPAVPAPGGSTREIAGIGYDPGLGVLYWLDVGNGLLHHTDLTGGWLASYPFSPLGPGVVGDLAVERTLPTQTPNPVLYVAIGDSLYGYDRTGMPTGFAISPVSLPLCDTRGVTSRGDNGHIELPRWKLGTTPTPGVCLDKTHPFSGLSVGAVETDLGSFGPIRGLSFAIAGSDGTPSIYILTSSSTTEFDALDRFSSFSRGDLSSDGAVGLDDANLLLDHLFDGGLLPCPAAADINDDDIVDLSDAICMMNFAMFGNFSIPQPFPYCGEDHTGTQALSCSGGTVCP